MTTLISIACSFAGAALAAVVVVLALWADRDAAVWGEGE